MPGEAIGDPVSLVGFILARVTEDEAVARAALDQALRDDNHFLDHGPPWVCDEQSEHVAMAPERVLDESAAKRRVVDAYGRYSRERVDYGDYHSGRISGLDYALLSIASVYANHDDYREEWSV